MEVSAHSGARPEHAIWQGSICSRSGKSRKYPDLRKYTGYGTVTGLCGANCSHEFFPYFEGSARAWSKADLAEMNKPVYEWQGKQLTKYEANQVQRGIERNIRKYKRKVAACQGAGEDESGAAAKVREWQQRQREFLAATGLKRQTVREQVAGFGRAENGVVTKAVNALEKQRKSDILKENIRIAGNLAKTAKIHLIPTEINVAALGFDDKHINSEREHKVSEAQAKQWIKGAEISVTVWNGKYERYYGYNGAVYVDLNIGRIRTAFSSEEYDENTEALMEVVRNGKL